MTEGKGLRKRMDGQWSVVKGKAREGKIAGKESRQRMKDRPKEQRRDAYDAVRER